MSARLYLRVLIALPQTAIEVRLSYKTAGQAVREVYVCTSVRENWEVRPLPIPPGHIVRGPIALLRPFGGLWHRAWLDGRSRRIIVVVKSDFARLCIEDRARQLEPIAMVARFAG
jgi:hypothetical protein